MMLNTRDGACLQSCNVCMQLGHPSATLTGSGRGHSQVENTIKDCILEAAGGHTAWRTETCPREARKACDNGAPKMEAVGRPPGYEIRQGVEVHSSPDPRTHDQGVPT